MERQRREETGGSSQLTNSDGLDAGSFEDAEHGAYARDATRIPRGAHVLCASPVDRAETDIVGPLLDRLARMLGRRARDADDHVWRNELASDAQGHVALSDMNTRGARRERDVYAIVDEDGDVVFQTQRDSILGYLEELFSFT